MVEKPRFRRGTVFAKNLGFGVSFGYRNNTSPQTAKIGWWLWGTPANFNGVRVLAALLHGTLHRESKKGCHPNDGYNFVNS